MCHKQEVGWEVFKSKAFGKPHCKGMAEKVHDAIVEEREHLRLPKARLSISITVAQAGSQQKLIVC